MFDSEGQRKESLKVCASGSHSRQQSCRLFPPTVSERQQKEADLGLRNGPSVAIQSGNDHLQHIWGSSIWHFYIVTYAAERRQWGWMMGENLPCVRLSPAEITNCASGFWRTSKGGIWKVTHPQQGGLMNGMRLIETSWTNSCCTVFGLLTLEWRSYFDTRPIILV